MAFGRHIRLALPAVVTNFKKTNDSYTQSLCLAIQFPTQHWIPMIVENCKTLLSLASKLSMPALCFQCGRWFRNLHQHQVMSTKCSMDNPIPRPILTSQTKENLRYCIPATRTATTPLRRTANCYPNTAQGGVHCLPTKHGTMLPTNQSGYQSHVPPYVDKSKLTADESPVHMDQYMDLDSDQHFSPGASVDTLRDCVQDAVSDSGDIRFPTNVQLALAVDSQSFLIGSHISFPNRTSDNTEDSDSDSLSNLHQSNVSSYKVLFDQRQFLQDCNVGKLSGISHLSGEHRLRLRVAEFCQKIRLPVAHVTIDGILDIVREEALYNNVDMGALSGSQWETLQAMRKATNSPAPPIPTCVAIDTLRNQQQLPTANDTQIGRTSRNQATTFHWNVKDQLLDQFHNSDLFGDLENLNVNPNDVFGMFNPPDDRYGEVLSGELYRRTYITYKRNHDLLSSIGRRGMISPKFPFFLMPLAISMDKTGTTAMERDGLEPVMVTTFLLKAKVRADVNTAWTPLGFLPDLDIKSKNQSKKDKQGSDLTKAFNHGMPCRNYHRCLRQILDQLSELQQTGMICRLTFGEHTQICHVYMPIFAIIGDIKSQDTLTGRIVSHHRSLNRLCWRCHCKFEDLANPECNCRKVQFHEFYRYLEGSEEISVIDPDTRRVLLGDPDPSQTEWFFQKCQESDNLSDTEEWSLEDLIPIKNPIMTPSQFQAYASLLRSHSLNRVDSVLNYLDYGCSDHNQYSACAIDVMHSLEGGIIKTVNGVFITHMNTAGKEQLERLIDRMLVDSKLRSSVMASFPRMNFNKGATNLTMLTCREWVGLLLAFVLVSSSYSGEKILDHYLKKSFKDKEAAYRKQLKEKKKKNGTSGISQGIDTDEWSLDSGGLPRGWEDNLAILSQSDDTPLPPVPCTRRGFVETSIKILCLNTFVNRETFWQRGDMTAKNRLSLWLRGLLREMISNIPRTRGNGWNLVKLHAIFFGICDSIEELGGLRHTNTNTPESGLRVWAKRPGQNTNRQSIVAVTGQTAKRLDEARLIGRAARVYGVSERKMKRKREDGSDPCIENANQRSNPGVSEVINDEKVTAKGSKFVVIFPKHGPDRAMYKWGVGRSDKRTKINDVHPTVVSAIAEYCVSKKKWRETMPAIVNVDCFTQLNISDTKSAVCHPNYLGKGAQFDWVILRDDPNGGHDCFFWNQKHRENIPNPRDSDNLVEDEAFQKMGETLLYSINDGDTNTLNRDVFERVRFKLLRDAKTKEIVFGTRTYKTGPLPPQFVVGDLPWVHGDRKHESWIENKYGCSAIPAKLVGLFSHPITKKIMAVVHTTRSQRIEEQYQSFSIIDRWVLQYTPSIETQRGKLVNNFDQWYSVYNIVDVSLIIDTLLVIEEHPGMAECIKYNEGLAEYCGAHLQGGASDYNLDEKKRYAMHSCRSVMAVRPTVDWGNIIMADITKDWSVFTKFQPPMCQLPESDSDSDRDQEDAEDVSPEDLEMFLEYCSANGIVGSSHNVEPFEQSSYRSSHCQVVRNGQPLRS